MRSASIMFYNLVLVLLGGRAVDSAVGNVWQLHVNCLDCLDSGTTLAR